MEQNSLLKLTVVPDDVCAQAVSMIEGWKEQHREEFVLGELNEIDEWMCVGPAWDLNIYTQDVGVIKATLYQVIYGCTDTSVGYPLL